MYTRIDVVHDAEVRATKFAEADRERYRSFMEAGEHHADKLGLIVGGAAATRLLLGDPADESAPPPTTLDSYYYEFYSGTAPADARALGKIMYQLDPDGLGHYTTVLTKVTNYLLTVDVDGRTLFAITALPSHRGLNTADVVMPSYRPAQFARDSNGVPLQLACTGPEIQLMSLYAALSNPAEASAWTQHMRAEQKLRAIFVREIRVKIAEAVSQVRGGASASTAKLVTLLRDRYATGPGRVVIGPVAVALMTGVPLKSDARLQVIAVSTLDSEARDIAAIAKTAGVEVQWTINNPNIPTDPRLRRMTVSAIAAGRREPILDVYNTGAHEVVPYVLVNDVVTGGRNRPRTRDRSRGHKRDRSQSGERAPSGDLKLGTPFVLLRFRLADMWTMQVLMRMKVVSANYANSVLLDMLADYNQLVSLYESLVATAEHGGSGAASTLFPLGAYVGRLEHAQLALKRAAQKNPRTKYFSPPYMPAADKN